ncbi:UPF0280 family protein [Rhodobacteraceae bacterium D3-12]|nr:UPF0280 family protein [Rhodobacteraceae bacterium D3-12]
MTFHHAILPDGRLHVQHGPIDLIIGAKGARDAAYGAALAAFDGVLEGLVAVLDRLKRDGWYGVRPPLGLNSPVAERMVEAVACHRGFVTPMAAVAGSVADHVLAAMTEVPGLHRAYVNNGGDIALYLVRGEVFRLAIAGLDGTGLGAVEIGARDGIGGVATSGQGGRSLSFGIAESVTVLAKDAAAADVAATLIANAVDLPGHSAIKRVAAEALQDDSDLGERRVVAHVGALDREEVTRALARGAKLAEDMQRQGLIGAAALFLRGQTRIVGQIARTEQRKVEHV